MANRTIYTRAYSKSSAGRFVSAKGPKGDPLSDIALLEEFRNHARKGNLEPTALVSGSDRIVDTLTRAFEKYFGDDYRDGELAADIWIAFIEVPPTMDEDATRIHSAEEWAEKCGDPEYKKFSHEFVFEWAIPEKYVVADLDGAWASRASLFTTVHCGSTTLYRERIPTTRPLGNRRHPRSLCTKVWSQGTLDWISHQLFRDCV